MKVTPMDDPSVDLIRKKYMMKPIFCELPRAMGRIEHKVSLEAFRAIEAEKQKHETHS